MFLSGVSINAPQTAIRLKKPERGVRAVFSACVFTSGA
jgi:hypothetical protein